MPLEGTPHASIGGKTAAHRSATSESGTSRAAPLNILPHSGVVPPCPHAFISDLHLALDEVIPRLEDVAQRGLAVDDTCVGAELTRKQGRNSLRCTMGRAKAAGACTSLSPTAMGYESDTYSTGRPACWEYAHERVGRR